jgi:hypothetical protein
VGKSAQVNKQFIDSDRLKYGENSNTCILTCSGKIIFRFDNWCNYFCLSSSISQYFREKHNCQRDVEFFRSSVSKNVLL